MQEITLVALAIERKQRQETASRTVNQREVGMNKSHYTRASCEH